MPLLAGVSDRGHAGGRSGMASSQPMLQKQPMANLPTRPRTRHLFQQTSAAKLEHLAVHPSRDNRRAKMQQ